ncbi:dynein regulatory complex subunit 4 [Xyrichtys novacula]|nr:dynein regulatory complex subunit 4 [Xyrichtys novacula]
MFWKITERQKEEAIAEEKILDKDIVEDESRHQVELQVYRQKMKHLLCEHQNTISELEADAVVTTEAIQEEQQQLESELHRELQTIKGDMQDFDHENLYKELCLKFDQELAERRNHVEEQIKSHEAKCKERVEQLKLKLENGSKTKTAERHEQWRSFIRSLQDQHSKATKEMETPCDVSNHESVPTAILDSEDYILARDPDLDCLQQQDEKHLYKLSELLSELQEEIATLEKRSPSMRTNYSERACPRELDRLKQEQKALEQKLGKFQLERDELYEAFTRSIQEAQQKGVSRSKLLEEKVRAVEERLENRQVQLDSLLSASNVDRTALLGLFNRMEGNLDSALNP